MMQEFEEPAYVFDFRGTLNCATTEGATPGQQVTVLVRPEKQLTAPSLRAIGTRSSTGDIFTIELTTTECIQTHSWVWTRY